MDAKERNHILAKDRATQYIGYRDTFGSTPQGRAVLMDILFDAGVFREIDETPEAARLHNFGVSILRRATLNLDIDMVMLDAAFTVVNEHDRETLEGIIFNNLQEDEDDE